MLRSLFLIALLFGVVIGLSGKAAAEPVAPCSDMVMAQPPAMAGMAQPTAMAGMADCCPDESKSGKDSAPCKDMAAACLAMAGCATVALHDQTYLAASAVAGNDHSWFRQNLPTLYGRSSPPDPYPPSRLG